MSCDLEKHRYKEMLQQDTRAVIDDEKVMASLDGELANAGTKSQAVKITKKADNKPDKHSIVYSAEDFNSMIAKAEEKALTRLQGLLLVITNCQPNFLICLEMFSVPQFNN